MILQFASILIALNLVPVWSLDADGDFDSQIASTSSELNDIIQDVQAGTPVAPPAVAPHENSNLDTAIRSMPAPEAELQLPLPSEGKEGTVDLNSKLPLAEQIEKAQKKLKTGSFVQTKLRVAITERSQRLQEAKDLLHRELNVLEQQTLLKLREESKVKKLQASIARMREEAAEEDKLLQASKTRTAFAQSKAESSEALDGEASRDTKFAQEEARAAHERLLHAQGVWQNGHQASLAKVARLKNVIESMTAEQGQHQSQGKQFEATSTALMKQIADIQAQVNAAATSKQTTDVNLAQVIHKWQETVKQLREQVTINSELSQEAKGGPEVQQQINELAKQIKDRDTQITDLQEQVDEASMQAEAGLRGVSNH